ncbi:acetolactate synthase large subunit [Algiphilus sp. NNCM1]|nr:acetolactate synthase large subunit [Algiphilus acroporae]MCI5063292.1 acetolactate synthase large subunit [Algiphilus sp.]
MKASDLMVRCLETEGVEFVFGIPGEENLDLLESLAHSRIKLILTRHEQAAGFMAATYGRLTGRAGVCLSTLGPGATNLVTAAAYAQLGAMPMVMITGQKPIKRSKQGQFQIIDVVDMMTPITKSTCQIVSGPSIPARVREAFRQADEERPGATHLELPEDIAAEDVDEQPIPASDVRRPVAEHKAISRAVALLSAARHPLLVIGAGANRKRCARMLRAFVDRQGIPFITTQMGKGVVDENHPLCLGNAAVSDGDFPHRAIEQSDCIVNVGHDVVEKPPFVMKTGARKVIHINYASAEVDPVYFPQVEVVGDIANAMWQLNEALSRQPNWDFDFMHSVCAAMHAHQEDGIFDARFPVTPARLVADIRRVMPSDSVIALDNGVYKIWFARNYNAAVPNSVLLDNALASMGAGLPSAMAAKLVHPDKPVMAICGDGGFMMNSQELETAVRLGLDLVVVVLNDSAYGMIKWKQQHMGLTDFGLDFGNPDFVAYAQSYGAHGHRLSATEQLVPLLKQCLASGGVHLVDVPVDYSDNDRVLNREIPERSRALQAAQG